ncbi:hypothetical protein ONS95_001967 [Cadophora gregata]|uniref:uncharacterized protein n=1 Tax=Cadophora gregata TaxID=51156 RepID=UPI0026DAED9D|nr:uncharacterized protein ONS95_001967 [Cadophora gregata]KAK0111621.1 hypothetical protein ONS95_001967 [Cadophora gregata]
MPKAARRTSGARPAPYPAIRPGDTPRSTSSTTKTTSKPSPSKSSAKKASAKPATKKALADKPSSSVNIPPKTKTTSKSKKAGPTSIENPSSEDIVPTGTVEADKQSPSTKPTPKKQKPATSKPSPPKRPGSNDTTHPHDPSASTFLDLTLPGESTSSVPMHDTCSTIRHKINDLLGKSNKKPENGNPAEPKKDGTLKPFTKASFVRAIGCTPKTLDTFLGAKKMMGGAESPVYPAAYIFFEKKRIWEGKKKTAGRLKVEEDRPNGLKLWDPNFRRIMIGPGEHVSDFTDKYGQCGP